MKPIWITEARYVEGYTLALTFSDGKQGHADLSEILHRRSKIFMPLLNVDEFKKFSLNDWTLSWQNGKLDIAPEALYEIGCLHHEKQ